MTLIRPLLLMAALFSLSACGASPALLMTGASLASFIHTDKTLTDHAVSYATEKDCSVLNLSNGYDYCDPPEGREREQIAYMAANLYCYRTLGGVNCYDRPDYTASNQTRINFGNTVIAPLNDVTLAARYGADSGGNPGADTE